ncbi:ATP-binding cassette domain-containing protein [Membranicola marinus]|uniref:ATP-binding cassette domain-containing protein n=1 Tax=Membranihabitans marinus TaxID=1227546 RepID=A0A953I274_9BACT|nr:ABC-F family ATP-binding cassette domain-containing protein [Membranihabitans marinus]MBY5959912.1 ATP-binding cassette domain-containing protein [Membranihabitans marinus]
MHILSAEHMTKVHGDRVLFEDLTIHMSQGDKIGFVAPNGSGKSTIIHMLTGKEQSDQRDFRLYINPDIRVGYLPQQEDIDESKTILDYIFSNPLPEIQAMRMYREARQNDDAELLSEAVQAMDASRGWDIESRIEEILTKLLVPDPQRLMGTLSGGQVKRVLLSRLLIDDPDLLILDEPTNHLDVEMIDWLENYLAQPSKTLFMVTHDRYFLEDVCTQILELDQGKLYQYPGNYAYFLEKREERAVLQETTTTKARKLMKKELDWINRMPKARTTKNKARVDAFDDIRKEAQQDIYRQELVFNIRPHRMGSKILECHHVSKSYGDLHLIKDFSYKWKKGEKIGLVGKNGTGKSTFIKMLTGEIAPDSGKIVTGENTRFGYFRQEERLPETDIPMIDVIRSVADHLPLKNGGSLSAEQLMERFLFPRPRHRVRYSLLSGGEKRRLQLLRVLMTNPNFLILDEPANDLDILTLNTLEEFLMEFEGCILLASHDRYMTDKIVDHLFILDGAGNVQDFNGSYNDYLSRDQSPAAPQNQVQPRSAENEYELRKKIRSVENQIQKLESKKTDIENRFQETNITPEQIKEWNIELDKVKDDIAAKESEWEASVEALES